MGMSTRGEYVIGDSWTPTMTVRDGSGSLVGDLSGYTVRYGMKRNASDEELIFDAIVGSGNAQSMVTATVPPSVTETLTPGAVWEEFELSTADRSVVKSFKRRAVLSDDIIPAPEAVP